MREFGFEMRLCARLEAEGELVARQLGGSPNGSRVVDAVVVEPGPGFDARARITPATIPPALLATEVGVGRARPVGELFADAPIDPGPERREELVDRGVETGYLAAERRRGRRQVRATARYPDDWFDGLLAVENKPDLGRPGDLADQLRTDVSLGLFDRVVVATASHVTGAHRNRIPDPVGIWRVDPGAGTREVIREPSPLPTGEGGIDVLDRRPGRADIEPVTAAETARYRRAVAERAYGKGWRVPFPDCPGVRNLTVAGVGGIPYCTRQERIVRPADACERGGDGPDRADDTGGTVDVDIDACRAANSPWVREPAGTRRQQAGLDRYAATE